MVAAGGGQEPVQAAAQGAVAVAGAARRDARRAAVVRLHGALVAPLQHLSRHQAPLPRSAQQRCTAAAPTSGAGAVLVPTYQFCMVD